LVPSAIGEAKEGSDSINTNLYRHFGDYFYPKSTRSHVRAWFWGHEHDFVQLERDFKGLGLAACLGHGAIPVNHTRHPRSRLLPTYSGIERAPLDNDLSVVDDYYRHGFSIMTLSKEKYGTIEHFEVNAKAQAASLGKANSKAYSF